MHFLNEECLSSPYYVRKGYYFWRFLSSYRHKLINTHYLDGIGRSLVVV